MEQTKSLCGMYAELFNKCISKLDNSLLQCVHSKHTSSSFSYDLTPCQSAWNEGIDEVTFTDGEWTAIDNRGLKIQLSSIDLYLLCEIADYIAKEYAQENYNNKHIQNL